MQSLFIHFCSNFPVFLKVNEKTLGTLENQTDSLLIETQNEKNLFVEVFPISNKDFLPSCSFASEIKIKNNTIFSNSNLLEITKFDENVFEVFLKPLTFCNEFSNKIVKEFNPAKNVKVFLRQNNLLEIEILAFGKQSKTNIFQMLKDTKCEYTQKENTQILFFSGKTQKNKDFLMIFENFFYKFEIEADVIEKNENEILALNFVHDLAKHGVVQKFVFEKSGFKLKEEYITFCENKEILPEHESLVPLAFLEALNLDDFKLARKFLSDELNCLLSDFQLKNFFGDFEEFVWNKHKNTKNCICFVFDGNPKTTKNFEFVVEDFKISNIFESNNS